MDEASGSDTQYYKREKKQMELGKNLGCWVSDSAGLRHGPRICMSNQMECNLILLVQSLLGELVYSIGPASCGVSLDSL